MRPASMTITLSSSGGSVPRSKRAPTMAVDVCADAVRVPNVSAASAWRQCRLFMARLSWRCLEVAPWAAFSDAIAFDAVDEHALGARIDAEGMLVPDDDVGILAHRERAYALVDAERPGGIERDPLHRFGLADVDAGAPAEVHA